MYNFLLFQPIPCSHIKDTPTPHFIQSDQQENKSKVQPYLLFYRNVLA
jgi:hypothetical protein